MSYRDARLVQHLERVQKHEGQEAAARTVCDMLDVLDELAEAGQNTHDLQDAVTLAGGRLKLLPEAAAQGLQIVRKFPKH